MSYMKNNFIIKGKHQEGEFAWEFEGRNGEITFGVQVKNEDKQKGIDMVKRSLVLNEEFGLKNKIEIETVRPVIAKKIDFHSPEKPVIGKIATIIPSKKIREIFDIII